MAGCCDMLKYLSRFSEAKNDLTICRITDCSASVSGGKEMLLFCDKVVKDDIQVRFFQEDQDGKVRFIKQPSYRIY